MDVVTSQRWMLGSLNFICGCFYITPLKQIFLPGIPWSLLLDINGTFLHHTRGWTFLLDTMVVVTGLWLYEWNIWNEFGKCVFFFSHRDTFGYQKEHQMARSGTRWLDKNWCCAGDFCLDEKYNCEKYNWTPNQQSIRLKDLKIGNFQEKSETFVWESRGTE